MSGGGSGALAPAAIRLIVAALLGITEGRDRAFGWDTGPVCSEVPCAGLCVRVWRACSHRGKGRYP